MENTIRHLKQALAASSTALPLLDSKMNKFVRYAKSNTIATAIFVLIFTTVLTLSVALPLSLKKKENTKSLANFSACKITMVESIPENLTYDAAAPKHKSIYSAMKYLLTTAKKSVRIASSYWSLRASDTHSTDPSSGEGEDIFNSLMRVGKQGNISIQVVQSEPTYRPNLDTQLLQKEGAAVVRSLNMKKLVGAGILHTKMWLVDDQHFYVGSANMDWRSLTQVKELGVLVTNCPNLAKDMQKIFDVYWNMSAPDATLPKKWPKAVETSFNVSTPMVITFNNTFKSEVYLSSSPPPFCPNGRTSDIDSIISVIDQAEKFVHISVMDYVPAVIYKPPKKFWPIIDDKLREVALNKGIEVRLLISDWVHSKPYMFPFLKSLDILYSDLTNVKVKLFKVPCFTPAQCKIPYARVNHNKYMVTDKTAYIGTSNWSGDYFISTGGIGFIIQGADRTGSPMRDQLAAIFHRDWNSNYTHTLNYTESKFL